MSYQSPIEIIYGDITNKLENGIFTAVQNVGINVDKDELIKALKYDRDQYHLGYSDAMMSAVEVVRCKDCKWWDKKGESPYGYCHACKHGHMSEHWEIGIYRKYREDWYCADGEKVSE